MTDVLIRRRTLGTDTDEGEGAVYKVERPGAGGAQPAHTFILDLARSIRKEISVF